MLRAFLRFDRMIQWFADTFGVEAHLQKSDFFYLCNVKKSPIRYAAALLLLGGLCACCRYDTQLLDAAEQTVRHNPDSTLALLSRIETPGKLRARDYARYALTLTKARYKAGEEMIADTLCDIAVNYFRQHLRDSSYAYETFYYAGQIARRRKEPEKAMTCFLQARKMLPAHGDWERHYVIETWIGVLSGEQGLYERKIDQARTAMKYADSLGNEDYRSISLGDMAHGFLGLGLRDSVEKYASEGLQVAEKTGIRRNITQKMALLNQTLLEKGDYARALEVNARALELADTANKYAFYMERANLLNRIGEYDSAFHYLALSRISPEPQKLQNRALRLHYLAAAHAGKRQFDSAYRHMIRYAELQDSVFARIHTAEVYKTEQLWKHNSLREENLLLRAQKLQREHWNYRIALLSGAGLLLIGACYFITWRRNKIRLIRQQRKIIRQHELLELRTREKQEADRTLAEMQRKEEQLRTLFFKQMSLSMLPAGEDSTRPPRLDWQAVFRHADAVFDDFTVRLRMRYPALNEDDLRFCCMVKMQLTQAEIARIVCLEKDSVKKRIKRIRLQKMVAPEGITLEEVLRNF